MKRIWQHGLVAAVAALALATTLDAQAAVPSAPDLSDAEVAHVAVTANTLDIELARYAQTRTRDAAVRQFAATMIADHTAVNAQAAALAGRLGVTPADNAVSKGLQAGASAARSSLERLEGRAFDRAYMDREIGYHQAVLDALDTVLIPTTSNGELKALLEKVRPAIATHLEHAKSVRAGLNGASQ